MYGLPNMQLIFDSQIYPTICDYIMYPPMFQYVYPYYSQPLLQLQPKMKPADHLNLQIHEPENKQTSQSEIVISGCPPIKTLESYILHIIEQNECADSLIKQCSKNQHEQLAIILERIQQKSKRNSKSREELIKYCLRKALKYMYKKVQLENQKSNMKSAKKIFSQTIFRGSQTSSVLPFKKDSINKTMNQEFLKELFSSQNFQANYQEFLEHFDEVMQNDKQKKIASLCHNILNHIVNDKIKPFDVKRLPWSDKLIDKTKLTAYELLIYK